jgi:dipeptidyl aminopeptidase/acylaminoacyl peptidase
MILGAATAAAIFVMLVISEQPARSQPVASPLPIDRALAIRVLPDFGRVTVSPDGKYVAYALRDVARQNRPIYNGCCILTSSGVSTDSYGADLYVTDIRSGVTNNITRGVGSNYFPLWSADSHRIAFFSDRDGELRAWQYDITSRSFRRLSTVRALPQPTLPAAWADGGKKLLFCVLPSGLSYDEENRISEYSHDALHPLVRGSTVAAYSYEKHAEGVPPSVQWLQGYDGFTNPAVWDLAEVDVASGRLIRVMHSLTGSLVASSPDARYAIITTYSGADPADFDNTLFDISIIDTVSLKSVLKLPAFPMEHGTSASWAPSGYRFALISGSRSEDQFNARWASVYPNRKTVQRRFGDVYVGDLLGFLRDVSPGEHPSFSTDDPPIWSQDGKSIFVLGGDAVWRIDVDSASVHRVTRPGKRQIASILTAVQGSQLWQPRTGNLLFTRSYETRTYQEEIDSVNISSGDTSTVSDGKRSYGDYSFTFDAPTARGGAVFAAMSSTQPMDLYATDDFAHTRQITHWNPIFGEYLMGKSKLVFWKGTDGRTYHGTLLLPAGYHSGRRYPLIIWQRPGNIGSYALDVFGLFSFENWQLMATRGYAVLYPDFPARGSSDVRRTAKTVLFPAIDELTALGIIDRDRIGLTGTSWGGYSTLVIISMTDRFKAALDESGFGDQFTKFSEFTHTGDGFYVQETAQDMHGTPWTARNAYINASPFFFVDRIHTPLMIVHARDNGDYALGETEEDPIFIGLRSLNRTVTMLQYDGGHGILTASYPSQVDIWTRIVNWFDKYLKY